MMSSWISLVAAVLQTLVLAAFGGAIYYLWRQERRPEQSSVNGKASRRKAVQQLLRRAYEIIEEHGSELVAFEESLDSNAKRDRLDAEDFHRDVTRVRDANQNLEQQVDSTVEALAAACENLMSQEKRGLEDYQKKTRDFDETLGQADSDVAMATLAGQLMTMVVGLREETKSIRAEITAANDRALKLMESAHQAERTARSDALTRLPNRRAFDEQQDDLRKSHQQHPYSLILLDIDFFKSVNDEFGHAAGDSVLSMIARILHERRRTSDFACRLGGEEFAILLPKCSESAAFEIAEKTRKRVESAKLRLRDQQVSVTVSCGVAESRSTDAKHNLIARADAALYWSKRHGRNRTCAASHLERDGENNASLGSQDKRAAPAESGV